MRASAIPPLLLCLLGAALWALGGCMSEQEASAPAERRDATRQVDGADVLSQSTPSTSV